MIEWNKKDFSKSVLWKEEWNAKGKVNEKTYILEVGDTTQNQMEINESGPKHQGN